MSVTSVNMPAPQDARGFSGSGDGPSEIFTKFDQAAALGPKPEGSPSHPPAGRREHLENNDVLQPEREDANKDSGSSPPPLSPIEETRRAAKALFGSGQVVEVRVPKLDGRGTASGYFDDLEKLAQNVRALSGKAEGVYWTLNPVDPALLARAQNKIVQPAKSTTADKDITRRVWLLVDVDPTRPSGVSATNEEKHKAYIVIDDVQRYLKQLGWSQPIVADSGNGYHLLYSIDLPNDTGNTQLIKGILNALAKRFDSPEAKVDRTVCNAARICKAYGSTAAKGKSTKERPHRMARILRIPESLTPVPLELLRSLAAPNEKVKESTAPAVKPSSQANPDLMEKFLDAYGIRYKRRAEYNGGWKWILGECPFDSSHKGTSVAVFISADGSLGFKCQHASCSQYHWKDFRSNLEERFGKKFEFHVEQSGSSTAVEREEHPIIEPPTPETEPAWRTHFKSYSEMEEGDIQFLATGIIPEGITFFGGAPGTGKTWLSLSLAKALITGRNFLGVYEVPKLMNVLYLIPEAGEKSFRVRMEKMRIQDNERFLCRTARQGIIALNNPYLLQAITELKPVVFLDTAIRFLSGTDENAAGQIAKNLGDMLLGLRQAGAPAIIGIHHATKASASGERMNLESTLRGSGDFGAICDSVFGLKCVDPVNMKVEVHHVKSRDFELLNKFEIQGRPYIDQKGDLVVIADPGQEELDWLDAEIEADPTSSVRKLASQTHIGRNRIPALAGKRGWQRKDKIWVKPERVLRLPLSEKAA